MALIKSALELALERTEGLSVDKEELRRKELFNQGRVASAKALDEGVDFFETAMKNQEKALKRDEYHLFAEGAAENLLSRILLATDPVSAANLTKVGTILDKLTRGKAGAPVQKIAAMLQQYGTEVGQLKQAITQQLGPQLKQRAQQSGANPATYVMERDPAYLKVLAENLEPLRAEYQAALEQLKAEIKALTSERLASLLTVVSRSSRAADSRRSAHRSYRGRLSS